MKQKLLLLISLVLIFNVSLNANVDSINDNQKRVVIINGNHRPQPHVCEPLVQFYTASSILTIDFGNQPVNNFIVTISSLYADVDYYATSTFTTIPIAVDGISDYSITIETGDGDLFEGTLYAADYATTATF